VDRADALGSPFDDLNSNHPHYLRVRSALARAVGAAADGQRIEVEMHVRGRAHTYVLKPLPLVHAEGRALGTILILQDVTHLRDQDRARINLVATLSHELKTPLTSLALSAELLARQADNLEPKQRQLVAAINEDVARMRRLAENLLDLARGDLAVIAVERSDLDLGPLIDEVVKGYAIQAEAKHVRLEKHDVEPGLQMRGDPIKLSWVVSNLIGNALRYTSENGAVIVSAARNGGNVRLEVVDSGPGIAAEVRDSIFERFAQWSANGAPQGSAGLGLAIVKEIVEAHDGRIFVESSVGQGSKFIVEFPARSE
jgi:signal transduction histidine kinase